MAAKQGGFVHPWFSGSRVEYLLVYRQHRRGKEDRWSLCSGRLAPIELVDDLGIAERYGAGYYQVTARGAGGRILGAPYRVGIPDEEGKVPVPSDDDAASMAASGGGADSLAPLLMDWLKVQQAQFRGELERVRADNAANMEVFAKINTATIESLTATRAGGGSDALEARFDSLAKSLEKVRDENSNLRVELVKAQSKRPKDGDDGEMVGAVLREAGPKLLEFFMDRRASPVRARTVVERVRASGAPRGGAPSSGAPRGGAASSDAPSSDAPSSDEDAGEVVVIEAREELSAEEITRRVRVLGWELPALEEVRKSVAEGSLSIKEVEWFRVLRDAGLLPSDYRAALVSAI